MTDFVGGDGDEQFAGTDGNDSGFGNGGNDLLVGNGGADLLDGGNGNDYLFSYNIHPFVADYGYSLLWTRDIGLEVDTLRGGAGNDYIAAGYGDNIDGGVGFDTLYLTLLGASNGLTLDFSASPAGTAIMIGGGTIAGVESLGQLVASNFDDRIVGSFDGIDTSNATVDGSGGNDHISGPAWAIFGGDGNDVIEGQDVEGGAGDDNIVMGGQGFAFGGTGNDDITSSFEGARGGDGDDVLRGRASQDGEGMLYGDQGNDLLIGASGTSLLIGGAGADMLYGNDGHDILVSGLGSNIEEYLLDNPDIDGERDHLFGGNGNDQLSIGYGDSADGGAGSDKLRVSLRGATSDVMLDLPALLAGGAGPGGMTLKSIESVAYVWGSNFADHIVVGAPSTAIKIDTGLGNDIVESLATNAAITLGDGDNLFIAGGTGGKVTGGSGIDTVDYGRVMVGVTVDLVQSLGGLGQGLLGFDNVTGSAFSDSLKGNARSNILLGGDGNDVLNGDDGTDLLDGGAGDDLIYADGSDRVEAGDGNDRLILGSAKALAGVFVGGSGNDVVDFNMARFDNHGDSVSFSGFDGLAQDGTLDGTAGHDRLDLSSLNFLSTFTLTIRGFEGNDVITGSGNIDRIEAGDGDDIIDGGAGDDILTGHVGTDRLDGGSGADTLIGGVGDDTYYVDDAGDVVIENDGEGYDNIFSSASVDASGNFVDYIYLTGSANADVTGNGLNNIIRANAGDNVLNGGAGIDQLSYSIATSGVTISLAAAGPQATGGSGTDTVSNFENIEGSLYSDHLTGNAGNNVIDGWWGGDRMAGLAGDDIYMVDHVRDNVVEVAGQGYDTIYSFVSYSLEGRDVEMLVLSGSGALNATGNASANTLIGNDDANVLDGKGGADLLIGEGGDDAYVVDGAGTRVIETEGEGYDSVRTSVDLNLSGQSIERVVMLGAARSLVGGDGGSRIVGTDGVNLILAGAGDDRVFGGAGDDRIEGGAGRDYLDGGAGVDSLSYEHAAAGVVVSLAIDGAQNTRGAGVDAVTGFENIRGSAFDDRLTGDDGANAISGLNGADVMIGLFGDDVYYVDNAGDRVVEKIHDGYDSVFAAVDFTLSGHVEALTLTGRGNIDATGNGQDNVLTGNAGDNRLNGGAGADVMIGKGGDDIYYVSSAGDVVVEQAGEGRDLVVSSVAFTLGDSVEDLRFVGGAHLVGHGNALANDMRGNAGSNTLWGGAGNDVLTGGAGGDNFVFDTALGADNVDRITDFSATDDHISLFRSVFGALGGENGSLAFGAFQTGAVALEADDRILFDSASGNIFYDADGSGAGAAVLFAQVTPGLTLSNFDFLVLG